MKKVVLIEKYRAKECNECHMFFPDTTDFFFKRAKPSVLLRTICKICCKKPEKLNRYVLTEKVRVKKCSRCNEIYPTIREFFTIAKNMPFGVRPECKKCKTNNNNKIHTLISNSEKEYYIFLYTKQFEILLEKKCTKCEKIHPNTTEFFKKDKKRQDKLTTVCKSCYKNSSKEYRKINKEKIQLNKKIYYSDVKNKEHKKENDKIYRQNNKEHNSNYMRIYVKNRAKTDFVFKLMRKIQGAINDSMRKNGFTKKSRTHEILGCSFEEFKTYIDNQFLSWMNWENHGLYNGEFNFGWDLDHKIPIDSAITEYDVIRLNHYTNFQPLCSKINRYIKKDKLDFRLVF